MSSKVIYYYQTFVGLDKLLTHIEDVDVIIVSSIHFDNIKGEKQIYLNDNLPDDSIFDELWLQTKKASVQGCKIMVMVGGAGGAYKQLFSDFETYYPLLVKMIKDKPWIQGVDLDIEENVNLSDVQMLIKKLKKDFGKEFIITMAPVSQTLQHDGSSMAGFNYKTLYQSDEGKYIDWFNTQCYGSYTLETYEKIINNGYPPEKVVFGMLAGDYTEFTKSLTEINKVKNKYNDMKGVFVWEYIQAPPDKNYPSQWCKIIKGV